MMEQLLPTIEAFAHYIRGVITLYFVYSCFQLYIYKRRNRMMRLLYYATLFLTFSHVKDAVFLFSEWKDSMVLNDLVRTIDMVFLPLVCAFFLEATNPGRITNQQLKMAVGLQSSFILAFVVYPDESVVYAAMSVAFSMSIITIVSVLVFSARYHQYITTNYSYTENLDVKWVTLSCIVYFVSLIVYLVAFEETTWFSEAMYNVFSLLLWTFLTLFARRHKVIQFIMKKENQTTIIPTQTEVVSEVQEAVQPVSNRDELMEVRLKHFMETDKLYLNPKLTLGDVALAIGTNKTYLSDFFNKTLHTTFYDYINIYRIKEACSIIDSMHQDGRKTMAMVASMSGFNSLSTFNRYFVKVKGIRPRKYYMSSIEMSSETK